MSQLLPPRYVRLTCGHVRITFRPATIGRVLPCFECRMSNHIEKVLTTEEAEGRMDSDSGGFKTKPTRGVTPKMSRFFDRLESAWRWITTCDICRRAWRDCRCYPEGMDERPASRQSHG